MSREKHLLYDEIAHIFYYMPIAQNFGDSMSRAKGGELLTQYYIFHTSFFFSYARVKRIIKSLSNIITFFLSILAKSNKASIN